MLGRLLAVPDSFVAMTTDRPYRETLSEERALYEIEQESGKQFDPVIVDAFARVLCKLVESDSLLPGALHPALESYASDKV